MLLVLRASGIRLKCDFQFVRGLGESCVISEVNLTSKIDMDIRTGHNILRNGLIRGVVIRNSQLSFVPAQKLFLHFINLTNLDISEGNTNLKVLNKNDFAEAERLTGLFLQNNEIQELNANNFNNTPALKYLVLSNNSIHTIEDNAFDGLSSLLTLKLDHNKLQTIREKTFFGLINLRLLNLTQNFIKTIHGNGFNDINIKELSLSGNECFDKNFYNFQNNMEGNEIYSMCRYHDETDLLEATTANSDFYNKQKNQIEYQVQIVDK